MSIAVDGEPANIRPTADPTLESIPSDFLEAEEPLFEAGVFFEADALERDDAFAPLRFGAERVEPAVVFGLEFSRAFEAVPDFFAPPAAVLLPSPPLLLAVDVFDPPRLDEVVALAAVFLDDESFDLVPTVEAPVFVELEDLAPALILEFPVFAVGDLEVF
jgi:hypothetical protein